MAECDLFIIKIPPMYFFFFFQGSKMKFFSILLAIGVYFNGIPDGNGDDSHEFPPRSKRVRYFGYLFKNGYAFHTYQYWYLPAKDLYYSPSASSKIFWSLSLSICFGLCQTFLVVVTSYILSYKFAYLARWKIFQHNIESRHHCEMQKPRQNILQN